MPKINNTIPASLTIDFSLSNAAIPSAKSRPGGSRRSQVIVIKIVRIGP